MKNWIRKILLMICICVFVYSAYQLVQIFINYRRIENKSNELIVNYVEEKDDPEDRKIDFEKLQKQNPDVIGWLYIPDTKIDEPILKGKNNDTYLRTDIDHQSNSAGQIFIDEINTKDFQDDNTIIYGHNMKNGSRFHDLRYYVKKDFYQEHPKVYIYLPNGQVNVYNIFVADIVDASSELYQKNIDDYKSYITKAQKGANQRSKISQEKAPLILLSTCYTTGSDERYIVIAQLNRDTQEG